MFQGDWLMDYTVRRLDGVAELAGVQAWLTRAFDIVRAFPPGLKPQVRVCIVGPMPPPPPPRVDG